MEDSCTQVTSNFTFTANNSDTHAVWSHKGSLKLFIFQITSLVIFFFNPEKVLAIWKCSPTKTLLDVKNIT